MRKPRAVRLIGVSVLIWTAIVSGNAHGQDRLFTIGTVSGQFGQLSEGSFRFFSDYLSPRVAGAVDSETLPHIFESFFSPKGRIDLLLTDVVLRGMNGRELSEHFTARHVDARGRLLSRVSAVLDQDDRAASDDGSDTFTKRDDDKGGL